MVEKYCIYTCLQKKKCNFIYLKMISDIGYDQVQYVTMYQNKTGSMFHNGVV